jgi:hypothetical protein|tara:strand:+ start:6321 stop:6530 length:210 start_codon:yes stop_codon:yes gene_type:complete
MQDKNNILPMQGINPSAFSGEMPQQPMMPANMDMNQYLLQKISEIKRRMFGEESGALASLMMQQPNRRM